MHAPLGAARPRRRTESKSATVDQAEDSAAAWPANHTHPRQARRHAPRLAGEILATLRAARARAARRAAPEDPQGARRGALRRAQGKPFFAALVDFITSGADARARGRAARPRSRSRTTIGATNRSTRRLGRFAATSRSRCRTTSSTARTRRRRPRARSRSGSQTESSDIPEYVAQNPSMDEDRTPSTRTGSAARAWARDDITWGIFGIPETELGRPRRRLRSRCRRARCGTAYLSAWLASAEPAGRASIRRRRSSRPREMQASPASSSRSSRGGEDVPLPDARSISPCRSTARPSGATRTGGLPEAARLLRPGAGSSSCATRLVDLCCPSTEPDASRDSSSGRSAT